MHHKHPKIARPAIGRYARTEFALVGSTCARMEQLMREWMRELSGSYRCLTVTGEHQEPEVPAAARYGRKAFASDHLSWTNFDDRLLGGGYDLALVNGNHYPAARQIVFIDAEKAGTLERRREQLTDVVAVIHVNGDLPDWLPEAPVLPLDRVGEVPALIAEALGEAVPPLRALILAGGRSQRMGEDKSRIVYRDGQTEVERLAGLCVALGVPASVSVRSEQDGEGFSLPLVTDRFVGLGPAGAICSAFLSDPDAAWLVLACDLPLLDESTLRRLIDARRPERVATAVRGPEQEWPEPLVAIYEPRAYQRLLRFLSLGYACPRKLLINSDTEVLTLREALPITNANTPEERRRVQNMLG
ncbi:NTP transferase domain-containing protein [Neolewinella litorea]|uniref:Molybdopterin-guanine dinucleotide biosynthesis protein MobA n=1 Tax=Neolewinella litorea TaxID=2562452 RepID=A0A4S4NQA2_9BACT|nr:NTP transferase domain-containing protein [Neolewinella litorea]THH40528.1 molybdopterin-guanine dinucleotide biosynthesis protein MobA [Neolewinella litorea]